MESLVIYLCGVWFWMTPRDQSLRYEEAAEFLNSAKLYLVSDFNSRWSTRDRGFLIPPQVEAIRILEQLQWMVSQPPRPVPSLSECVQLVKEELLQPPKAA